MRNAAWMIGVEDFGIPPTCKFMDKIYFTYEETDISQKPYARENHVVIGFFVIEQMFKEISQTRYLN